MDNYLFEQVVYISPLLHKMKIRKTKFASFWGEICLNVYLSIFEIFGDFY